MSHQADCKCPACRYRRGEGKGQAPHLSIRIAPDVKACIMNASEGARAYIERLVRGQADQVDLRAQITRLEALTSRMEHEHQDHLRRERALRHRIQQLEQQLETARAWDSPEETPAPTTVKRRLYSVSIAELPTGLIAPKGWTKLTRVKATSEEDAITLGVTKLLGKRCRFLMEKKGGPGQYWGVVAPLKDCPQGARARIDVDLEA